MPRRDRLRRYLSINWDHDAARRMEQEAEHSLERAGKLGADALEEKLKQGGQKGARALTSALQREYKLRMARASQNLAEGTINERAFRREGEEAAREFNRGLSDGIKKLQASSGGLTDPQFAGLASRYKGVGGSGGFFALGGKAVLGPLAGLVTASRALDEARQSVDAAEELDRSVQKLAGTAKLTGIQLSFLEGTAADLKGEFRGVSQVIANDLTTEVVRLTSGAGRIQDTGKALRSLLDLGAARGLRLEETLSAIGQAVLGIDEGTDKLFGKNPSAIYAEWASKAGRSAASLSDTEKMVALLDATLASGQRTRGEYSKWLETTTGQADAKATELRELQAEAGKAIQPFHLLALELKVGLYQALGGIVTRMKEMKAIGFSPAGVGYGELIPDVPAPDSDRVVAPRYGRSFREQMEDARQEMVAAMIAARRSNPIPSPLPPEPTEKEKREAEEHIKSLWEHLGEWINRNDPELNILGTLGVPRDLIAERDRRRAARDLFERRGGSLSRVEAFGEGSPGIVDPRVLTDAEERLREFWLNAEESAERAAMTTAEVWQDAFALMIDEGFTVDNFFEGLSRSIAGSLGGALSDYAAGEAKKHYAEAIGAVAYALGFTSTGNFASASAATASAAEHTAAAVAFSALAGGAAAGGGALRSRAPGSSYDSGLSVAERNRPDAGNIIIYMDPFNPRNPAHADAAGRAVNLDVRLGGRPDRSRR